MRTTTWVLNITLPANTPAYTPIRATIVVPEAGASYTEYPTGSNSVIIDDASVTSAPSVDYLIRVTVDRKAVAGISQIPASLMVATNPAKKKAFDPAIGVTPQKFITIEVIPLSNVGSSAVNHTAFLSVKVIG